MVVEDRLVRVEAIMEEMRSTLTRIDNRLDRMDVRLDRLEDRVWWLAGMIFTAWVSTFLAVIVFSS